MPSSATAKRVVSLLLFRGLLPIVLLAASLVRYNGFSLLYLCLLLAEPLLPSPSPVSMRGKTRGYFIVSLTACSVTLLAQVVFQAFLLISASDDQPYGTTLKNCSLIESSLRQLGLQRLEPNDFINILRVILPDIGAFIITLVVFLVCRSLTQRNPSSDTQQRHSLQSQTSVIKSQIQDFCTKALNLVGNFLIALFLAASAIAYPCALSGIYFLTFLCVATWWACYRSLGKRFAYVRIGLLVYSGSHMIVMYLYQFQFFQEALIPGSMLARVLGLNAMVTTDCRKPWVLQISQSVLWPMYVSPILTLLLYFVLACETQRWCEKVQLEDASVANMPDGSPIMGAAATEDGRNRSRYRSDSSERQALVSEEHPNYNSVNDASATRDASPAVAHRASDAGPLNLLQRTAIKSAFMYLMKQSYVATLIVMMVWSITYHSWLTFVFLILACIIWMVPQKRSVCLLLSPVIVLYAECLLIVQYIYGFNLPELPTTTSGGYKFKEIGLVSYAYPCGVLAVQIGFTIVYLLTLRQRMRERHLSRQMYYMQGLALEPLSGAQAGANTSAKTQPSLSGTESVDGYDSDTIKALGHWVWIKLCKYWILVCAVLLLVMAIPEAVIYRILYMFFFLYFVLTFQLVHRWWRLSIYVFWWVVIIYSMIVLLCIYTYQFEDFPGYWMNGTGISDQLLMDVGLEQFDTATLFVKLLTPTSFVIIICLQLHYFQAPFLQISDVNRFRPKETKKPQKKRGDDETGETVPADDAEGNDDNPEEGPSQGAESDPREGGQDQPKPTKKGWLGRFSVWLQRIVKKGYELLNKVSVLLWRLVEIHVIKIVMFTIFICSCAEVSAASVPLVVFVAIMMPVPALHGVLSHLCQLWTALVILAKMIYQLHLVSADEALTNCTGVKNLNTTGGDLPFPFNQTIDNAVYLGLQKTADLPYYLGHYVIIVCIVAFEAIVKLHQRQCYNAPDVDKPKTGIVFPATRRVDADKSLLDCLKYFINYAFYKFGLQICFIMTVVTMVVRLDAYSVIYGIFLGVLLLLNRRQCYIMWPIYIIVLLVLLILQYLACLGVPEGLCWDYPWDFIVEMTRNLKIYLYLPSYVDPPNPYLLIADFFQLLFVCCQWYVLRLENSSQREEYGGGSNSCIISEVEHKAPNPIEDFLYCKDSYLDYIKSGIFQYSLTVTLIFVFIAGTAKISLFCLGYLVGFFFFIWHGQELLIRPLRKLIRIWGILLGYCFFVLLSKSLLQLVGCVYIKQIAENSCWVVQLLGLACLRSGSYIFVAEDMAKCQQVDDDAGLTWDAVCFVFLLIQLRVYKSHYFRHIVLELEVQNLLASRGAELINMHLIRQVAEQKQREADTLCLIKNKMERIRMRQARLQQRTMGDMHHYRADEGDLLEEEEEEEEEETAQPLPSSLASPPSLSHCPPREVPMRWPPGRRAARSSSYRSAVSSGGPKPRPSLGRRLSYRQALSENGSHTEVIRSGDYYMFDEDSDEDTESGLDTLDAHDDDESYSEDKAGPLQILNAAMSSGTKGALQVVERHKSISEGSDQHSPPPISPLREPSKTGLGEIDEHPLKDAELEEEDQDTEPKKKDGLCKKFLNLLKLLGALIGGFLDYVISVLRDISRTYRSVSHILDREKEEAKRKRQDALPSQDPAEAGDPEAAISPPDNTQLLSQRRPQDISILVDVGDDTDGKEDRQTDGLESSINVLEQSERDFRRKMPRLLQLIISLFEALMSRSENVCYFAMILNHLVSASLLSLPFPLSVFLWAMLSVPRPSKTYWLTILTYTEAVVLVKYLFQFGFFPWNDDKIHEGPFWPPRILGIEKRNMYAAFDLVLLFCLFIHRSILKRHGLWKDTVDIDADFAKAEDKVVSRHSSPAVSPMVAGVPALPSSEGDSGRDNATFVPTTPTEPPGASNYEQGSAAKDTGQPDAHGEQDVDGGGGRCLGCCRPFIKFYYQMTNPRYSAVTDVYAVMFLCDFIVFLIVVFGYWAFGPSASAGGSGSETVTSVIQENRVPAPFLAMLLTQFVLIIIDRALYLRKNILGKFLFQICLVILVHVWMFFILPSITNRSFNENTPAQLWYFTKCVYFGFSAYQIKSGYPTRILGNFLTKKYNYVNLFLFKGFLLIPFLLELRALMDWIWTDTTLALTSWLKMEDIYANIFELKCWRTAEEKYPTPRGIPRKKVVKYGVGGLLLFLLIFILWFPLLLFSLANAVFEPNPPTDVSMEIKLGGYQALFSMSAQQQNLQPISGTEYSALKDMYSTNGAATAFLNAYHAEDVYIGKINGTSTSTWDISPPSQGSLEQNLNGEGDIDLFITMAISREPKSGMNSERVLNQFQRKMYASDPAWHQIRKALAAMIDGSSNSSVLINEVFPPCLVIPVNGKPEPAQVLLGYSNSSWSNVTFKLDRKAPPSDEQWWHLSELRSKHLFKPDLVKTSFDNIQVVTFNERIAPGALTFFTSYGVIGLYVSLVLVVGQFMRIYFIGTLGAIMFDELPLVDRILKLCLDIYLIRESAEWELEEELFSKLIFLYRSPETMIKWTKPKQE